MLQIPRTRQSSQWSHWTHSPRRRGSHHYFLTTNILIWWSAKCQQEINEIVIHWGENVFSGKWIYFNSRYSQTYLLHCVRISAVAWQCQVKGRRPPQPHGRIMDCVLGIFEKSDCTIIMLSCQLYHHNHYHTTGCHCVSLISPLLWLSIIYLYHSIAKTQWTYLEVRGEDKNHEAEGRGGCKSFNPLKPSDVYMSQ